MTGVLKPVTALLLAAAILMTGHGLATMLIPIRASIESFTSIEIGIIGAANYMGLVAGCMLAPLVIGRVGFIRAFGVFSATLTVVPLLHAVVPDAIAWIVLRALYGICFAGLVLCIESWLNAASEPETRGRVLGTYTLIQLTVLTLGMQMIGVSAPGGFELFSLVAILISLAAVPVALTNAIAPVPPKRTRLRLGWLYSVSPAATMAAFLTGFATGAFWVLGPLYARDVGFSVTGAATFVSTAVLAGAVMQWPFGSLSDRIGRRVMLGAAAILACGASLGLYLAGNVSPTLVLIMSAAFGASSLPIYTLALAHANDLVAKRRAMAVSGGLLMLFSLGAATGPLATSFAVEWMGFGALFAANLIANGAIAMIVFVRGQIRPKIPTRHREDFVLMPRTTPAVFTMDPRTDTPDATPIPPQSFTEATVHPVPDVIAPDGELPASQAPEATPEETDKAKLAEPA